MEPTPRPPTDPLKRISALLEAIAYQGTSRTQDIEPYLCGLYAAYRKRNRAAQEATHDGQEHA